MLRPGGRFAVSDVVADPDMDAATRADMAAWTGCVAGALTRGGVRARARRRGPRRRRDPRDPPRPRARGLGHRPRAQAGLMATALFVCRHNAGRSQMSAALFERARRRAPPRAVGRHRGRPGGRVHPEVVEVMREFGIDLSGRRPQRAHARARRAGRRRGDHGLRRRMPVRPGHALRRLGARGSRRAGRRRGACHARRDRAPRRGLVAELDAAFSARGTRRPAGGAPRAPSARAE